MINTIYLDNAATTYVSDKAASQMRYILSFSRFNPNSLYPAARRARKSIDKARWQIAKCIGVQRKDADKIIFTSGGSESNTLALIGMKDFLRSNKRHIAVSAIEHPSVLNAVETLAHEGVPVKTISVDSNGHIILSDDLLYDKQHGTSLGLLSVMAVNNELGAIQDLREIGVWCRSRGVFFHTDCVQALDTIPIDVDELFIDFLSVSAHKIHGPSGAGFLYARNPEHLSCIIEGGGQERGLRGGTENTMGIVAMAEAVKETYKRVQEAYKMPVLSMPYVALKRVFMEELTNNAERLGLTMHFNGDSSTNESKILSVRFDGIDAQTLVLALGTAGVYVSAGSACHSSSNDPSHVLKAIGLSDDEAMSTIRISFSEETTIDEAKEASRIICECVDMLKEV